MLATGRRALCLVLVTAAVPACMLSLEPVPARDAAPSPDTLDLVPPPDLPSIDPPAPPDAVDLDTGRDVPFDLRPDLQAADLGRDLPVDLGSETGRPDVHVDVHRDFVRVDLMICATEEVCGNGSDDDCNSMVDEGCGCGGSYGSACLVRSDCCTGAVDCVANRCCATPRGTCFSGTDCCGTGTCSSGRCCAPVAFDCSMAADCCAGLDCRTPGGVCCIPSGRPCMPTDPSLNCCTGMCLSTGSCR